MDKRIVIKRILSLFLAVVLVMGTVTVAVPKMAEAAENEITLSWNGYWDAFVYDIQGLEKPSATEQYCFDSIYVDGVEVKGTVLADLTDTPQFAIWDSYWNGASKPTQSVLIKAGTTVRQFDIGTAWSTIDGGKTYTVKNNVYVTSSDNGTTWVATEYSETPAPPTPPAPSVTMREVTAEVAANSSATDFWLTTNPEVYTYYGDWAGAISKVLIDDVETSVQWNITSLGIYIDLPENWTTVKVAKDTEFTINYNGGNKTDTTPFKITNDIVWSKANAKVSTDVKWESFELYVESDQLILRTDVNLNTLYPWGKLKGNVLLDGKAKEVEWNIEDNLIFTVDITCDEYQKAESVVVEKDTVFTLSADADKTIKLTNRFGLKKIGGAWLEESQTKAEYNDVKISLSSSDGRGFYLNAEIVAGPDKGKTIGGKDVYGDWKTSATGTITYNGTKTMDVFFSTTGSMIYISGDYDLSKITQIELKAGTVLLPMENAQCKTMLRLANDLKLAKDTRYNRWVLAGQENQQYQFNDVTLEVTRVTGAVLEMRGTFKNQSNKQLKDIYGDWVLLNGAITLGDPSTGTRTDEGAVWSLAGDLLMLYGVQAGIMDSIKIPSGTILWPDSSCKSENPIRIVYDVVLTRNADDEWVIQSGKPSAGNGGAQNNNSSSVESEKNETAKEELTVSVSKDVTNVRLVDAKSNETKKDKTTTASNNSIVYVAVGVTSALLAALLVGCLVVAKKRKKGE